MNLISQLQISLTLSTPRSIISSTSAAQFSGLGHHRGFFHLWHLMLIYLTWPQPLTIPALIQLFPHFFLSIWELDCSIFSQSITGFTLSSFHDPWPQPLSHQHTQLPWSPRPPAPLPNPGANWWADIFVLSLSLLKPVGENYPAMDTEATPVLGF